MEFKDKVIKPYVPVETQELNKEVRVNVLDRQYTFGSNSLPSSLISKGEEILSSPFRIVGIEDGEELEFTVNEMRLFSHNQEQATICGSMQSNCFIVNTTFKTEYDGYTYFDLKLMPRGNTVAEEFGLGGKKKPKQYNLERLWLEVPLKQDQSFLYMFREGGNFYREDGSIYKKTGDNEFDNVSGILEEGVSYRLGFKPLIWLGNDDRGFGFVFPSDQNVELADENRFIEIINKGNERVLRIRFLDNYPSVWKKQIEDAKASGKPLTLDNVFAISYSFGMQITPIRTFPKSPLVHNAIHIDCFKKVEGDYIDFLANPVVPGDTEIGYDRLQRLGVTTLVLHEKWNNMQNNPVISEFTKKQISTIVKECHKRGIKVIPYFGYEFSSFAPDFAENYEEALYKSELGYYCGGWWREPSQRAYQLCPASKRTDMWLDGIKKLIETYHFDGVYLDGTTGIGYPCTNEKHGCGYVDINGVRKATRPIHQSRERIKRLYSIIEPLGGIINYHDSTNNLATMGFAHLAYSGELFQTKFIHNGVDNFPSDFLRAEFTGRNLGIPVDMLVYEHRPNWTFEHCTALGLAHGTFPRTNDIGDSLDFISKVWKIFNAFPMEQSTFVAYWNNTKFKFSDENVKCSYYEYEDVLGKKHYLIIGANLSSNTLSNVKVDCENMKMTVLNGTAKEGKDGISFDKYTYFVAAVE